MRSLPRMPGRTASPAARTLRGRATPPIPGVADQLKAAPSFQFVQQGRFKEGNMNTDPPDGYKNVTGMACPADGTAPDGGRDLLDEEATAREAVAITQEAKRVEKIRSHASSHHCSGTVSIDAKLPRPELAKAGTPSAAPANTGDVRT